MEVHSQTPGILKPPVPCTVEEILPLRRDVFFPGKTLDQARYPGDRDPMACHFAGYLKLKGQADDLLVACVSMLIGQYESRPAWRIRGLAVHEAYRGLDIGSRFLDDAVRRICMDTPVHLIWCAAKDDTYGFYEKLGWKLVDEVYLMQGAGTHFKRV